MPIYDYHCDHCGHTFSAVQSYTDATLEICPSCGKKPRKLMATPAIVFKGGGWYKTDSRAAPKDGAADGAKDGAKDDAKGTGATDKDTKAAPAAATESAKSDAPKSDAPKSDAPKSDKATPAAPKGDSASS